MEIDKHVSKFCKNCAFLENPLYGKDEWKCKRGGEKKACPLDGADVFVDLPLCRDERTTGKCGPNGDFWRKT